MAELFSEIPAETPGIWKRFRLPILSGVGVLVLSLAYCGYAQRRYVPMAPTAVDAFHQQFATGQYDAIIFDSDPDWTRATGPETTRKFFARIHRKMGVCSYQGPLGWSANTGSNATLVVLGYQARCEHGLMREKFTLRVTNNNARVVAYNATSDLLLTD